LNRLIRDNDRLQRIIVRHGGAELFRTVGAASSSPSDLPANGRDDLAETSYHRMNNSMGSPGMQFAARGTTSSSSSATKQPIYSSRIRESLTPPGKFNKSRADSDSPLKRSSGGGGPGNNVQQELQDRLSQSRSKHSVGFEEGRPRLSTKYATTISSSSYDKGRDLSPHRSGGEGIGRVPESPPPPPKSLKSGLNWGALDESLKLQVRIRLLSLFRKQAQNISTKKNHCFILKNLPQESNDKPKFSSSHLPPDDFPLDESVYLTKSARNGKLGIGIEENAVRVASQMNALDNYLKVEIKIPHVYVCI
jgi:hypothetical protein